MLVEKIEGKLCDYKGYEVEYVGIEWHECHKRILKKELADGSFLGIRLSSEDAQVGIYQDDVFCVEGNKVYVADILKTEALVIDTQGYQMMPKVCYEIGNRHAPFFKGEGEFEFYTPYEMPIKVMLEKLGVKVFVDTVQLSKDRAISSAVSSHNHSHDDGGYDGNNGKADEKFYDDTYHHHGDGVYHSHSHDDHHDDEV